MPVGEGLLDPVGADDAGDRSVGVRNPDHQEEMKVAGSLVLNESLAAAIDGPVRVDTMVEHKLVAEVQ
jgi:hypothetical protein